MLCISVVQLLSIHHQWLPDFTPAPTEGHLGIVAVVGQEVRGSELDQGCPGVGEEQPAVKQTSQAD